MATNTSDFFTFSKTAGTAKNLQKPTDGGDNNLWGGYINVDLDTIVGAVNATSDLIADANQNELVDFTATGSAVNHVGITNAATGNGPTIEAKGDDTNIDLNISGKGTGKLATTSPKITTGINDSNNNELIKVTATGSAVNEITVANAATGNGPTLSATGDDTNIDLLLKSKGTGDVKITGELKTSAGVLFDAFASGTKMLFQQTSAPTGWTKITSSNDVALRVVSGTVGSGGSVAFETAFASHTPTITVATHSLSTAELPAHTHGIPFSASTGSFERIPKGGAHDTFGATYDSGNGGSTLSGDAHGHPGSSSSAIDIDVQYIDVIIASKD